MAAICWSLARLTVNYVVVIRDYLYPRLRDYKPQDTGLKQGWYLLETVDWSSSLYPTLKHQSANFPLKCVIFDLLTRHLCQ